MKLLIDFDSILYTSVYRVVGIVAMRDAIEKYGKENARQWLNEEVYNEGINRCENELLKMQNYLQNQIFQEISGIELYITTCKNPFRKELNPNYKKSRKPNKYVWLLRGHYQMNGAIFSDTHEADDLIYDRAKELGKDHCIIVSIDKDLKQIGGYYWSYYKTKSFDMQGNPVLNEYGEQERDYRQRTIDYITDKEADRIFWLSMLSGDHGDDIKGLHRVGIKTAEKILTDSVCDWIRVAREYIARGQKEDFKINYRLLKLGV